MKKTVLAGIAFMAIVMVGCRKDPINNLTAEESRIYITNYDSGVSFSNYKTFSIADSVAVFDGNEHGSQFNQTDAAFVNAVKSSMQKLGYTLVSRTENPDIGVTVSRIYNTSTGIISYDDYWGNYGGYYDPYYWGYSGYGWGNPSWGYATYQVQEGLLSVDMLDLKDAASNNNQVKAIWNGMIRGSGIFDANTAASQINQLFSQSSYIQTN